MVIVPTFYAGGQDSIPGRVKPLCSVSVNHSLTGPRCKNGTSECGLGRIMCASPAWDVWRRHCSHSPQGEAYTNIGFPLWMLSENCKPPLTRMCQAGGISSAVTLVCTYSYCNLRGWDGSTLKPCVDYYGVELLRKIASTLFGPGPIYNRLCEIGSYIITHRLNIFYTCSVTVA